MTRYFHVVLNNKFTKLLSIDYWRHIGRSAIVYGECNCIYIDYKKYWRTQSAPGWFVQGKNVTGWHHQRYIFIDPVDTDNWTMGMSTDTVVFTCEYSESIKAILINAFRWMNQSYVLLPVCNLVGFRMLFWNFYSLLKFFMLTQVPPFSIRKIVRCGSREMTRRRAIWVAAIDKARLFQSRPSWSARIC